MDFGAALACLDKEGQSVIHLVQKFEPKAGCPTTGRGVLIRAADGSAKTYSFVFWAPAGTEPTLPMVHTPPVRDIQMQWQVTEV